MTSLSHWLSSVPKPPTNDSFAEARHSPSGRGIGDDRDEHVPCDIASDKKNTDTHTRSPAEWELEYLVERIQICVPVQLPLPIRSAEALSGFANGAGPCTKSSRTKWQ